MDGPPEYEVESVTRARVHDKRGKKITWKYYVKWKGYGWDDSTWEPTDSFQGGSEHILESFWQRIDTGGRDIADAAAFKKGEELLVSGPPGRKSLKRKASSAKTRVAPTSEDVPISNGVAISAPPLAPRKRRRVQVTADDSWGYSKRRGSTGGPKNEGTSARSAKRRRVSSPGPRKSAAKRQPSPGDSQLDADGETDPDVVEVEDELMQVSPEDAEDGTAGTRHAATASGSANGSKKIIFDDLEHFYSGNPIVIDQNTDEQMAVQKPESRARLQSPPPAIAQSSDDAPPDTEAPASPTLSNADPLFDSPPPPSDKATEVQKDLDLPHHRARAAKPLVKLIDTTTLETTSKQSRITAKARLMSIHAADAPSISGPSRNIAKRGGKPGPGRSSSGLTTKSRSSLLTVTKGTLKTVKGKYARTTTERDQSDEIEETPAAPDTSEGDQLHVASWSDEDMTSQGDQMMSTSQPAPPPSGDELLKLAGLQTDPETLPDYEDDSPAQPQEIKEPQGSNSTSAPAEEESPNQSLVEATEGCKASDHVADSSPSDSEAAQHASASVIDNPSVPSVVASAVDEVTEGCKASDHVADSSPSVSEAAQQASASVIDDPSVPSIVAPVVDEVKKNIELAKEHLFPSAQTSFNSFSTTQSSFRSTIFGPLYQGSTANHVLATKNEFSTTFKVILGDAVELPLLLKDCSELKARISDILIGNSSGSKVALFYSAVDALAMVSTFKSDGTARVVLDLSATTTQQQRFSVFLQRFEASQTLIAPVGKEVCVLYSSENADITERLGAPPHLRGLSSTLLISHASIENQLAYVAAIMKATAVQI